MSAPAAHLRELSQVLWRERQLLDLLHFKLEVERMLLEADRNRWIGDAGREVEMVLDELGQVEMERVLVLAHVSAGLGIGTEPSLVTVVGAAPEPWNALFEGHRQALRSKADDVQRLADENVVLLRDADAGTRRDLAGMTEPVTDGLHGGASSRDRAFDLVEAAEQSDVVTELRLRLVALECTLTATERVLQPSLVEFLR